MLFVSLPASQYMTMIPPQNSHKLTSRDNQKRGWSIQARQLLVSQRANVTTATFEVEYESATQSSREYKRKFWMAPGRNAAQVAARTRASSD